MQIEYLDGAALKAMVQAAASWLGVNKETVDALNVFPVPDGDTGTNMYLTLQAAAREVEKVRESLSLTRVADAAAQGSLMGARGNSGVILSQLFRGFAKGVAGKETIDARGLAKGFSSASRQAYQAVMKPVEGTILTVAKEAARAAVEAAERDTDIVVVLQATLVQARRTLALTPQMLPVLREARVVDAGGKGLVVALEGAFRALQGGQVDWDHVAEEEKSQARNAVETAPAKAGIGAAFESRESLDYKYCTEFVLKGEGHLNLDKIKRDLGPHGDCLLVVGDEQVAKIHIHSNRPGWVLEYCAKLGDMIEIHINNMVEQHEEFEAKASTDEYGVSETTVNSTIPTKSIGVVAVVVGEGLEEIFQSLGADSIVHGGQSMNPSTEELLKAVESTGAEQVIILPNNGNVILTAAQVKDLTSRRVSVLPTRNMPQGIAALLALNSAKSLDENFKAMSDAFGHVKSGEVTYAVRKTRFNGVEVEEKDTIGLLDDQLKAAGKSLPDVTESLVGEMVRDGAEIATLYHGADVPREEAEALVERLQKTFPKVEMELHYGGQPLYYYLISVE